MSVYARLCFEERVRIWAYRQQGDSLSEIAKKVSRPKSTLSRELNRLGGSRYWPKDAQYNANARARSRREPGKLHTNRRLLREVLVGLRKKWSPEQISRYLRMKHPKDPDMQVSYETIYTYLYVLPRGELREELIRCLRQKKKSRYRRSGTKDRRGKITEMISIEERPKNVESRSVPGHWEGDLILGKAHKTALGTLVERKTRAVILVGIRERSATAVRRAFEREMRTIPRQMRLSLTYDQGHEMAEHRLFTKNTRMKVYFCHPSSPWERGTCENTNGLIRDFFPKGTDFSKISRRQIKRAQKLLNERPRKTLAFRTPKEVFNKEVLKIVPLDP
jgi:transposase, IS30 family